MKSESRWLHDFQSSIVPNTGFSKNIKAESSPIQKEDRFQCVINNHGWLASAEYKERKNKQPWRQSQTYHYYLHNTLHKILCGIKQNKKKPARPLDKPQFVQSKYLKNGLLHFSKAGNEDVHLETDNSSTNVSHISMAMQPSGTALANKPLQTNGAFRVLTVNQPDKNPVLLLF